jgi:hypothetical protein
VALQIVNPKNQLVKQVEQDLAHGPDRSFGRVARLNMRHWSAGDITIIHAIPQRRDRGLPGQKPAQVLWRVLSRRARHGPAPGCPSAPLTDLAFGTRKQALDVLPVHEPEQGRQNSHQSGHAALAQRPQGQRRRHRGDQCRQ